MTKAPLKKIFLFILAVSLALLQTPAYSLIQNQAPHLPEASHNRSERLAQLKNISSNLPCARGQVIVKLKKGCKLSDVENVTRECGVVSVVELCSKKLSAEAKLADLQKRKTQLLPTQNNQYPSSASVTYQQLDQQIRAEQDLVDRLQRRKKRAFSQAVALTSFQGQIFLMKASESMDSHEMMKEYQTNPNVEYAEPNYIVQTQWVPNDPYYSSRGSWGQPYEDLWGIRKIQAEKAWDFAQGENVIVAVVDTGVDYTHPDLAANIWTNNAEIPNNGIDDDGNGYIDDVRGWDFTTCAKTGFFGCLIPKLPDNNPIDGNGHGTHCSGTIAAVGNNGKGVIGVAPRAMIMPLKGLSDQGAGKISELAEAILYATDNGADVISNSWGGSIHSQLLVDVFHYAHSQGVVCIAAAGNSNADTSNFSPAGIDTVIAVGAATQKDEKASFSNYGRKVDLSAPGGGYENELGHGRSDLYNILSTMPDKGEIAREQPKLKISSGYYRIAGTSMACPHVAGLAALILSRYPDESVEDVRGRMIGTTDPYPPGIPRLFGSGRINAFQALSFPPRPSFLIESIQTQEFQGNGDQIPGSGEEASMVIRLRNVWKDASSVRGTLSSNDAAVASISIADASFGVIHHGEVQGNDQSPFIFKIGKIPTTTKTSASFVLTIQADGTKQIVRVNISLGIRTVLQTSGIVVSPPKISGNLIAWIELINAGEGFVFNTEGDIHLCDLRKNGDQSTLSRFHTTSYGFDVGSVDISGDWIAFEDFDKSSGLVNLRLFDLKPDNFQIKTVPASSKSVQMLNPIKIMGSRVGWIEVRTDGDYEYRDLHIYDLNTGFSKTIPHSDSAVDFSISGDVIVYTKGPIFPKVDDLYLYNLVSGEERTLAKGGDRIRASPLISEDTVAWAQSQIYLPQNPSNGHKRDIHLYDVKTKIERTVGTIDPSWKILDGLSSGNLIAWEDIPDDFFAPATAYLYDLKNDIQLQLEDRLGPGLSFSENRIAWWDNDGFLYVSGLPDSLLSSRCPVQQDPFFVHQLYRDLLHREADAGGLAAWISQMKAGLSRANLMVGFMGSPEYQNYEGFVLRAYRILARRADRAGFLHYVAALRSGASQEAVVSGMVGSGEFTGRFPDATNDVGFMHRVYWNILERAPDIPSFWHWYGLLVTKRATRGQVALDILNSAEALAKSKNNAIVQGLYQGLLQRDPDQNGFIGWLNQLNAGVSLDKVISGFLNSGEYRKGRFGCDDST